MNDLVKTRSVFIPSTVLNWARGPSDFVRITLAGTFKIYSSDEPSVIFDGPQSVFQPPLFRFRLSVVVREQILTWFLHLVLAGIFRSTK